MIEINKIKILPQSVIVVITPWIKMTLFWHFSCGQTHTHMQIYAYTMAFACLDVRYAAWTFANDDKHIQLQIVQYSMVANYFNVDELTTPWSTAVVIRTNAINIQMRPLPPSNHQYPCHNTVCTATHARSTTWHQLKWRIPKIVNKHIKPPQRLLYSISLSKIRSRHGIGLPNRQLSFIHAFLVAYG